MAVLAAAIWYFVVFEPEGALVTTPMPFADHEQCETAKAEFKEKYPTTNWDTECITPEN